MYMQRKLRVRGKKVDEDVEEGVTEECQETLENPSKSINSLCIVNISKQLL